MPYIKAAVPPPANAFVSDSNFSSVFGVTEPAGMCFVALAVYIRLGTILFDFLFSLIFKLRLFFVNTTFFCRKILQFTMRSIN